MSVLTEGQPQLPIDADLSFITPRSKVNRRYVSPGKDVNTGVYETKKVKIHDARPIQSDCTLDNHGFQLIDSPSSVSKC